MIALIELLILCTVLCVLGELYDRSLAETVVTLLGFRDYQISASAVLLLSEELAELLEHILHECGNSVLVEYESVRSYDTLSPELNEIEYGDITRHDKVMMIPSGALSLLCHCYELQI